MEMYSLPEYDAATDSFKDGPLPKGVAAYFGKPLDKRNYYSDWGEPEQLQVVNDTECNKFQIITAILKYFYQAGLQIDVKEANFIIGQYLNLKTTLSTI